MENNPNGSSGNVGATDNPQRPVASGNDGNNTRDTGKPRAAEGSKAVPARNVKFVGVRRVIELPIVHQRGTPQTLLEYLDMGQCHVLYANNARPERPLTYLEDVFELDATEAGSTPEHKEESSAVDATPSPEGNLSEDQPTHQETPHIGSRLSIGSLLNPQEGQPGSSGDMTIRDGELPSRGTQANEMSAADDLPGGHGLESPAESSEAIDTASSRDDESVHQENDQNPPAELSLANDGATSQQPEPEASLPQNQLPEMKHTEKEMKENESTGEPSQAEEKPADKPADGPSDEPDENLPILQKHTDDMPYEPPADGSAKVLYTFWEMDGYRKIALFNLRNYQITEKEVEESMRNLVEGHTGIAEIKRGQENLEKKMDALYNMFREFCERFSRE